MSKDWRDGKPGLTTTPGGHGDWLWECIEKGVNMNIVECEQCEFCSQVKREVLGIDICLSPDTLAVEISPGAERNCSYYTVKHKNPAWNRCYGV